LRDVLKDSFKVIEKLFEKRTTSRRRLGFTDLTS